MQGMCTLPLTDDPTLMAHLFDPLGAPNSEPFGEPFMLYYNSLLAEAHDAQLKPTWCPYRPYAMTDIGAPEYPLQPAHHASNIAKAMIPTKIHDTCAVGAHTYALISYAPITCEASALWAYLKDTRCPLLPVGVVKLHIQAQRKATRNRPLMDLLRVTWVRRWERYDTLLGHARVDRHNAARALDLPVNRTVEVVTSDTNCGACAAPTSGHSAGPAPGSLRLCHSCEQGVTGGHLVPTAALRQKHVLAICYAHRETEQSCKAPPPLSHQVPTLAESGVDITGLIIHTDPHNSTKDVQHGLQPTHFARVADAVRLT